MIPHIIPRQKSHKLLLIPPNIPATLTRLSQRGPI